MRISYPRFWLLCDICVGVALSATTFLSAWIWHAGIGDVHLYHDYAVAFWTQLPQFTHLPVEYPPLAVLPFSLTLLAGGDPEIPFAVATVVILFAVYLALPLWVPKRTAIIVVVYLLLGEQMLLLARYDLYPTLLALAGLWATERGRYGQAYVWLTLGGLVKIFPFFLIPVVALAQIRTISADKPLSWPALRAGALALMRSLAPGLATLVGIMALALWRSPRALGFLFFANQRPIQIESLFATAGFVGWMAGDPLRLIFSYGSVNVVGPLVDHLIPWSLPLLALGCGAVYAAYARGAMPLRRAFLAVIAVTIITGKVFSPQYILWLLPFAAISEGLSLGWVALCVLHTLVFAAGMSSSHYTSAQEMRFALVTAARNGLLCALTVGLFFAPQAWRKRARMLLRPPQAESHMIAKMQDAAET